MNIKLGINGFGRIGILKQNGGACSYDWSAALITGVK